MFTLSGYAVALTTVLYGWRMGDLLLSLSWVERFARGSIGLLLAAVALGFFQRSGEQAADFRWFHWLILGATVCTAASYCVLLWRCRQRP